MTERYLRLSASRVPANYIDPPVRSTTSVPVSSVSPSLQVAPINSNKLEGTFLRSAFVGQPASVNQVGGLWIGGSEAACQMINNAELMYDIGPPLPNRSRVILRGGSTKKVESNGKFDLIFHRKT